jgi:hypothetical protein
MSNDLIPTSGAAKGAAEFSREDLALVGDAFDSPSILPEAEIDKELKEIARFMRDNRPAYFKDEAMQARQRELLAMKAQWTEHHQQDRRTRTRAAQILTSMPDADAFEQNFDRMWANLDEAARDVIRYELARPSTDFPARPASAAQVEKFASTPEGKELVQKWGARAAKKIAIINFRADAILTADIDDEALDWFEKLKPEHVAKIYEALASE